VLIGGWWQAAAPIVEHVTAPVDTADLRARLDGLTLRDAQRLRRRVDKLRRGHEDAARVAAAIDAAQGRVDRRRAAVPDVITFPPELPVSARRDDLREAIAQHQVVVVAGETGSGKTTQLPKICLELGRGVRGAIAHTQPRRLAARTVAERIADELGVQLGEAVGYAVRFNDRSGEDTLVRLMTDGLLLAETGNDRLLRAYDTIIVDEAHERSLNIDFLLGYLRRILPERPDLKVIITSATIDPARFAAHFGDAPVVEVSGRTYPVEVRYRPVEEEADAVEAIGDAVEELHREGPGDVLVFLSGEREIRDAAEGLRGRLAADVEILPLYARLTTEEQHRVFRRPSGPHRSRVVLATNVAETSLTVPGIRYVVDPGTARISRYSARLKVQRLPIEPISQASADQRKGRCGRTADGICIRLYAEEDFEARPRFTDPEILRTSLASVLLQMAVAGLGEVEDFPFLDPPDRRQVRDAATLLQELGAFGADRRITPLGRRLAGLPVDPRMGRMVLAADELGCAQEVTVIAAALSIQDPRERPADAREEADALHARFADPSSDFLSLLNLWELVRERQRELTGNQFRKRLKAEHLHVLRIREWQDLVAQLRQAAKAVGVHRNQQPAEPDAIHRALLAGLLSHVGLRDPRRREYGGARGARFALWPGSVLGRRQPDWVMVAELVETSRLWGRTAARIDPSWIEPLAEHLVRRMYDDPYWDRRRGSVVAKERVTLYGLPIVDGRKVAYGRIDPVAAREVFIRKALVERDWQTRHAFFAENGRALEEVEALEDRVRRRGILVADQVLYDFFDARIPERVVSATEFDRWWREERRRRPDLLTYTRALLIDPAAADGLAARGWPATWRQGDLELELSYRFEPGAPDDGVTAHVPLRALGTVKADRFEWLVPALRRELLTALLRGLPKDLRRPLVPVPEVVGQVLERLEARRVPLLDDVARVLAEVRGVRVSPGDFDLAKLPDHLRMRFQIEGPEGEVLAAGRDLQALREELRPRLRAELASAAAGLERSGLTAWGDLVLPKTIALPGTGGAVRAHPALVDEGATVGVAVLDTPAGQAEAMRAGTRRLLVLGIPSPAKAVQDRLGTAAALTLAGAPHGGVRAVLEDARDAAVDALVAEAGGPVWDAEAFARLRAHVAGRLVAGTAQVAEAMVAVLDAAREVRLRLDALRGAGLRAVRADVERQLARLVPPGFATRHGAARLGDLQRYLRAAARRLDRLPDALGADAQKMGVVAELEELAATRPDLPDVPWLLEELRVSQFAESVGAKGGASAKRIRRLLTER
jgi:ATP-dependent helicase HrpA